MSAHKTVSRGQMGEQLDMFAEHFREANPPTDWYGDADYDSDHVETSFDNSGQMIFLKRGVFHRDDIEVTGAFKQSGEGGYENVGTLSTKTHGPDRRQSIRDPQAMREVSLVDVRPQHRLRGIATALWHVAGEDRDLRHSAVRTDMGWKWSHKVGGFTVSGRDVLDEPEER